MRRRRLNPSAEQERRAAEVMRDPDLDLDAAIDLANRILAGEEVAYALAGTGLVVDTSPRPAQIAEIETAQGVVEVPVREVEHVEMRAGMLEMGHNIPEDEYRERAYQLAEQRKQEKRQREQATWRQVAQTQASMQMTAVEAAVQAIDAAQHTAQTARRHAETVGLRKHVEQILAGLLVSDLKKVAQHYNVNLQRTPADQRVEKIAEVAVGYILRNRAVRGDYEEDEEARVRERDEQTQMQIDAYRAAKDEIRRLRREAAQERRYASMNSGLGIYNKSDLTAIARGYRKAAKLEGQAKNIAEKMGMREEAASAANEEISCLEEAERYQQQADKWNSGMKSVRGI